MTHTHTMSKTILERQHNGWTLRWCLLCARAFWCDSFGRIILKRAA